MYKSLINPVYLISVLYILKAFESFGIKKVFYLLSCYCDMEKECNDQEQHTMVKVNEFCHLHLFANLTSSF